METPSALDEQELIPNRRRRRRRSSRRSRWAKRIKKRLARYNWVIVSLMIGSVVASIIMSALLLAFNARDQVNDSWQSLDRVWASVGDTAGTELTLADFDRLQRSINELNSSLTSAKRQTAFLQPFSFINADFAISLELLDAAQYLTQAANDILLGMEPALFFLSEGEAEESVVKQLSSGERVVELLSLGRNRFLSAEQKLFLTQNLIDSFELENASAELLTTIEGLIDYTEQLQGVNQTLLNSPELLTSALGLAETKTYLVLSQNSDELRPSGGFISTYGWITVRNGRIVDYDYRASTATTPNPPSLEMASALDIPDWWGPYDPEIIAAWDGSWHAHFPITADMAAWYYNNGGNPRSPVDGVIGIDLAGFEYILEGLGSVTVPSYDVTVTSTNFREEIYRIREDEGAHKRFLAALYQQIFEDWQNVDQATSIELRGASLRALQEKHMMLYFLNNADLNQAMSELGWLGEQQPALENDYLMVVDANLGNKANRSVLRQVTYDVDIQSDGTLQSRMTIDYDYSARVAEQDPAVGPKHGTIDYKSLLQVFVPALSTLTGTDNLSTDPTVVMEANHTIFVSRIGIKYNESERVQFSYTTPVLVERVGSYWRYKLVLQKQPGTLTEVVHVQIKLPEGARAIDVVPAAVNSYQLEQPILEFRMDLTTDQEIEIIYAKS